MPTRSLPGCQLPCDLGSSAGFPLSPFAKLASYTLVAIVLRFWLLPEREVWPCQDQADFDRQEIVGLVHVTPREASFLLLRHHRNTLPSAIADIQACEHVIGHRKTYLHAVL